MHKRWGMEGCFELQIPELQIKRGERVALMGLSGCGKSTLLDMLALLLRPDHMEDFSFAPGARKDFDVVAYWESGDQDSLAGLRRRHMGYVLQTGGLLPFLTVRDNIGLGRRLLRLPRSGVVEDLARRLSLSDQLGKLPAMLSVGERQRVAIARAMAHNPTVVIADEPTASLDPITADNIMRLFTELADDYGVTLVVASHDWERVEANGYRPLVFRPQAPTDRGGSLVLVQG